jgi:oxygen-independent coproporphyrinogen-3 oxidase
MSSDPYPGAAAVRAAYVHIPFCRRRCPYCDFAVVDMTREEPAIDRYVDALLDEISMEEPWGPLEAVNFGGGTPSALSAVQLGRILGRLTARFGVAPGAEISIEANPEDWDEAHAAAVRELGFNRVSLGVQSFDAAVLAYLGRNHAPHDGIAAVAGSRHAGFEVTNLDLIFGAPGESFRSWEETVSVALDLDVEHLSAYALTVERGTALSRAIDSGAPAPNDDDQADKYEHLVETVPSRLEHYEVSNWADREWQCRYNMTTWAQGEYVAFGLGAHSYRNGIRRRNVRRLDAYLDRVEAGLRPEAGAERLTGWEKEKERVFLGIRRRKGVAAGVVGEVFAASTPGRRFVDAGVVSLAAGRLVIANPLLTDAVARELLSLSPDESRPGSSH